MNQTLSLTFKKIRACKSPQNKRIGDQGHRKVPAVGSGEGGWSLLPSVPPASTPQGAASRATTHTVGQRGFQRSEVGIIF